MVTPWTHEMRIVRQRGNLAVAEVVRKNEQRQQPKRYYVCEMSGVNLRAAVPIDVKRSKGEVGMISVSDLDNIVTPRTKPHAMQLFRSLGGAS